MKKGRLEAFSDGVIAIIITIMVLELKVPHEQTIEALTPLVPVLLSYVLSFIYVAIYWNNHHHLFQTVEEVNGTILWANLHLLFWLSLIPFITGWLGENHFAPWPVVAYGFVLLMSGAAFEILFHTLVHYHDDESLFVKALGGDRKGTISCILYIAAILLAFFYSTWPALAIYVGVAVMWLIPYRKVEIAVKEEEKKEKTHEEV